MRIYKVSNSVSESDSQLSSAKFRVIRSSEFREVRKLQSESAEKLLISTFLSAFSFSMVKSLWAIISSVLLQNFFIRLLRWRIFWSSLIMCWVSETAFQFSSVISVFCIILCLWYLVTVFNTLFCSWLSLSQSAWVITRLYFQLIYLRQWAQKSETL